MFPLMDDIAEQMCAKWERIGDHTIIDVVDNLTRLTLDTYADYQPTKVIELLYARSIIDSTASTPQICILLSMRWSIHSSKQEQKQDVYGLSRNYLSKQRKNTKVTST